MAYLLPVMTYWKSESNMKRKWGGLDLSRFVPIERSANQNSPEIVGLCGPRTDFTAFFHYLEME